ncbi:MAG TPA: FHA domain-containing protein [Flavisolibacter sp.]|nr:FHA domain-containing protein [Flavisolibacter sp.]
MFDFFKQNVEDQKGDVKIVRHQLLQFIKEQLQRWEGGEGRNIKGMQLFLNPIEEEKNFYESIVSYDEKDTFKQEIQRIADDYSIDLPQSWNFEILFVEELPKEATKAANLQAALHVSTRKQPNLTKATTAYVKILNGEAEEPVYTISASSGKICIGREKRVQTEDGFMRENTIAFPGDRHESNKYISRQHAHIEWDKEEGDFFLYADEGGVPPRNKVKVQPAAGGLIKLQTTEIGHRLEEGDQILLGESALLQFSYLEQ